MLFLFFAFVATAMISVKILGDGGPLMTILVTAAVAFIMYDYIKNKRKRIRATCEVKPSDYVEPDIDVLENMDFSIDIDDSTEFAKDEHKPVEINIDNGASVEETFQQMGSVADNKAANLQRYRGMQESLSIALKEKNNKYSALPWLEEELREHEARDWWLDDKYIPEI